MELIIENIQKQILHKKPGRNQKLNIRHIMSYIPW